MLYDGYFQLARKNAKCITNMHGWKFIDVYQKI